MKEAIKLAAALVWLNETKKKGGVRESLEDRYGMYADLGLIEEPEAPEMPADSVMADSVEVEGAEGNTGDDGNWWNWFLDLF